MCITARRAIAAAQAPGGYGHNRQRAACYSAHKSEPKKLPHMAQALAVIRLSAAGWKTSVRRTIGMAPDEMTSANS